MYKITYFGKDDASGNVHINDYLVRNYEFKVLSEQFFMLVLVRDDEPELTLIYRCEDLAGLKIVEVEDV